MQLLAPDRAINNQSCTTLSHVLLNKVLAATCTLSEELYSRRHLLLGTSPSFGGKSGLLPRCSHTGHRSGVVSNCKSRSLDSVSTLTSLFSGRTQPKIPKEKLLSYMIMTYNNYQNHTIFIYAPTHIYTYIYTYMYTHINIYVYVVN